MTELPGSQDIDVLDMIDGHIEKVSNFIIEWQFILKRMKEKRDELYDDVLTMRAKGYSPEEVGDYLLREWKNFCDSVRMEYYNNLQQGGDL